MYLPENRKDAVVTGIGRSSSTGTGDVGQGYQNPNIGNIPDGSGFPSGTTVNVEERRDFWKRTEVNFQKSNSTNRIGVFYATIERDSNSVTIPIIKMSETGKLI